MRFYSVALIFFFTIVFLGCGIDDEDDAMDNGDSIESAKPPVISVRKVKEELVVKNNMEGIDVFFQLVADTAPKTDILVFSGTHTTDSENGLYTHGGLYVESGTQDQWITIPKGQKKSQTFSEKVTLNGNIFVYIDKIPTVEFVGEKGTFVDQEKLEKYWGSHTWENKRIPDGFKFPYYEVGDPSELELYQPKNNAKIIRVEPPSGSRVPRTAQIKITFDTPPFLPIAVPELPSDINPIGTVTALSSTTFLVRFGWVRSPEIVSFVFWWGDPLHGSRRSPFGRLTQRERNQVFTYKVE